MSLLPSGDTHAFDVIYDRYSGRLLHYFFKMFGGNEAKAQDFLQSLFLKLVEKPNKFRSNFNFNTWIYTIAHNMCKNEYRKQDIRKKRVYDLENNYSDKYEAVVKNDVENKLDYDKFRNALNTELDKIDPDHRSTFILRFQENLSIKEIKDILGCSEGTVKSRLFYTTRKLAKSLKVFNPYKFEVN